MSEQTATEQPAPARPGRDPSTAAELLRSIYRHPAPYVSVYLQTRPLLNDPEADLHRRWSAIRTDLTAGAPPAALEAIDARLALPAPEETAGIGVLAAADGHAIVDHALEPPRDDLGRVDNLPHVGPLIEWDQHRVPHLVVTIDRAGADVVEFGIDNWSTVESTTLIGNRDELAAELVRRASAVGARLVVIAGDPALRRELAAALGRLVHPECQVVVDYHATADDLADATVRHVYDTAARTTVQYLREFRFLASHEAAVDGTKATIEALTSGEPDVLLIHDDPDDQRRVWIGEDPTLLSLEPGPDLDTQARFVDAAIRSATVQGMAVHIIPTTGANGPHDDIAALQRDQTTSSS